MPLFILEDDLSNFRMFKYLIINTVIAFSIKIWLNYRMKMAMCRHLESRFYFWILNDDQFNDDQYIIMHH